MKLKVKEEPEEAEDIWPEGTPHSQVAGVENKETQRICFGL